MSLLFADNFRDYQLSAIDMILKYIDDFEGLDKHGCSVVCHPTGSGKTAIIGGVTQCSKEVGSSLVLTTRKAVRNQLYVELSSNLFVNKFDCGEDIVLPKLVYPIVAAKDLKRPARSVAYEALNGLLPAGLQAFLGKQIDKIVPDNTRTCQDELLNGSAILVSTIQMLGTMHRQDALEDIDLASALDLVLFDEGHYQPAIQWSAAIRALSCPTALFTATPFRNDLRPFIVKKDYFDIYHHQTAIDAGIIRSVAVEKREKIRTPSKFAADIKSFCLQQFGEREHWPRIVICCADHIRIEEIGQQFVTDDIPVVAVHDQFENPRTLRGGSLSPDWQYHDVPPPTETDALVWIHQRKLLEGIDDNRFRVLAFFDLMRNGREMVQQIGRVLRTGSDDESIGKTAFVLDHSGGRIERDWQAFLEYDAQLTKETLFDVMSKDYLRKFLEIHPPIEYIEGSFRKRFDLENFTPIVDELLFKRQVNLFRAPAEMNFDNVVTDQSELPGQEDAILVQRFHRDNCAVFVSLRQHNPEFLSSSFYSELRHNVRVIIYFPEYEVVAVSDALGAALGPSLSNLRPLASANILKTLSPSKNGRIASLSSRNTNVSNRVARSKTVRAASLVKVSAQIDDHGHVLSTVQGWDSTQYRINDDLTEFLDEESFEFPTASALIAERKQHLDASNDQKSVADPELIRRYVSTTTGRVSESGKPLRLGHFRAWVQSLVEQINTASEPEDDDVFRRFAPSSEPPIYPMAKNILLDLFEVEEQFVLEGHALNYDDLCMNRVKTRVDKKHGDQAVFLLRLNHIEFDLCVSYNPKTLRYRVDCPDLDKLVIPVDADSNQIFTRYLNQTQSFSILPEDLSTMYVHGQFYAPGILYGDKFDEAKFYAGRCLIPCGRLDGISSEKGEFVLDEIKNKTQLGGRYYDPNSLFGLIDAWDEGIASSLDIQRVSETTNSEMIEALISQVSFTPNIVICDDIGRESADFILANDQLGIVVLVHAKATSSRKPCSASAMQEVCAQAQKNANLYSFFSLRKPGNYSLWGKAHRFPGPLSLEKRIRKPYGERKDVIWKRLEALLLNPQTTKEIWIVAGNMLSVSDFRKKLKLNEPPPEVIQLNHLIETTIASTTAIGARLRIFCMP